MVSGACVGRLVRSADLLQGRSYVSRLAFPGVPQTTEVPEAASWFCRIATDHLSVPCILWRHERPRAVLLYLHGNAMCLGEMRALVRELSAALSCHVLAPEIPGLQYDWGRTAFKSGGLFVFCFLALSGGTDGEPQPASEEFYYEAAIGAFDWARKTVSAKNCCFCSDCRSFRICLWWCMDSRWAQELHGEKEICPILSFLKILSFSSEVCVARQPAAAVLQSPLLSAVRVAFPNLRFSIPWTDIFLSVSKAPHFQCPTLVVHGARDAVIAVSHGRELAERIPANHLREYVEFPEAGHNDVEALYWGVLMQKVDQLIASLKH